MRQIPWALVLFRLAAAPTMALLIWRGATGGWLVALLVAALGSDIFDGVIARRLGTATAALRRADSAVDTVFYVAVLATSVVRWPQAFAAHRVGIGLLIGLELVRFWVDGVKFRRMAAYHMWSAKAWGLALAAGFAELFLTGQAGPLFAFAVWLGVATDVEGLIASLVFSKPHHDVPSLVHAIRLERQTEPQPVRLEG